MDVLATVLTALVGGPKHHDRLLRLHTSLGPDVLVVETLHGLEALSPCASGIAGFRIELTALSVDAHLDLAALLGQPVLLELLTAESIDAVRLEGSPPGGRPEASPLGGRPFHGHVSAIERVGSNGGLARYRLVVEPWLAFSRQRIDSFVFQDMTVIEIVESVFTDYNDNGALVPAWRWDLADPLAYPQRSLTTQYEESDLGFVERLLAAEGLFYWFEHSGDAGSDSLGAHTLVIADHNDAFADTGRIRYHRSDVTERSDSIGQWATARRWQTTHLHRASWDHRGLALRSTQASGVQHGDVAAADVDTAGPYAWPDRDNGQRYADQQLQALQVSAQTVHGSGSWRQQRVGGRFVLSQHPAYPDEGSAGFVCTWLQHSARNNLDADVMAVVEQHLGVASLGAQTLPDAFVFDLGRAQAPGQGHATRLSDLPGTRHSRAGGNPATSSPAVASQPADFYANHFDALPAAVSYRASTTDGHGLRLHAKPTVHGAQTAVVVSDGAPTQTDRDHRIKVQFPWQRGANAGNRLAHTSGDDNAPASGGAWTWVRVAGPWAGDNWGSVLLPRAGQEVLVAFLEGDIDRPVVIGAAYNGCGQLDAAHNQVAAGAANATGNAPAWFEGNGHAAVFTGFKTQAMADSQSGSGGFQQLRLDDTPGQGRALASTTQQDSTLTLGHLKGGRDNVRGGERGFGVELSTQASGALRAGAGLLLSTEPGQQQLTATGAQAQLAQSEQLVASLSDAATSQDATLPDEAGEPPAHAALKQLQQSLQATSTTRAAGDGIGGGEGSAPGWASPAIIASSPDGIVAVTPADQVWVSGTQTTLSADKDLQWLSQGETVLTVAGGIVLYAHGTQPSAGKPNQETGIALHAAQGPVSARAHDNLARIAAQTSVTIASTQADVSVAASKHLLLTAAGAYLKMEGGNIELGAPGTIDFKASKKEWTGPQSISQKSMALPRAEWVNLNSLRFALEGSDELVELMDWIDRPFKILDGDGKELAAGTIGKDGRLPRVMSERAGELRLLVGKDKWLQQQDESSPSAVARDEEGEAAMFSEFVNGQSHEPFDPSDPYMAELGQDDDALPKDLIAELMGVDPE